MLYNKPVDYLQEVCGLFTGNLWGNCIITNKESAFRHPLCSHFSHFITTLSLLNLGVRQLPLRHWGHNGVVGYPLLRNSPARMELILQLQHLLCSTFHLGFFIFIASFPLGYIKLTSIFRLGFIRKGNNFLCISKKMATFAPV